MSPLWVDKGVGATDARDEKIKQSQEVGRYYPNHKEKKEGRSDTSFLCLLSHTISSISVVFVLVFFGVAFVEYGPECRSHTNHILYLMNSIEHHVFVVAFAY